MGKKNDENKIIEVPEGKIIDFIDGKLRKDTPEEYVRQNIEKSLVKEYKYPKEDMAIEFSVKVGSKRKRVDIAVFAEGKKHIQENIIMLVECKKGGDKKIDPDDRKEGVDQLQSYMAASVNCEFGLWTNGSDRRCYRKVSTTFEHKFEDITDIPTKGKPFDEAERPKRKDLKPATADNLKFTFKQCHNFLTGNYTTDKQRTFFELLKLIFCKIQDEKKNKDLQFYATTTELNSVNGQMMVKQRIDELFKQVRQDKKNKGIFEASDEILIGKDNPHALAWVVNKLQKYTLLRTDVDVKGTAYEEIVGSNLRGDRGEFFTPRNVCNLAVNMLEPNPELIMLDPACGTGGFLITWLNAVLNVIKEDEKEKWVNPERPTESEQNQLFHRLAEYAAGNVYGLDSNLTLIQASKMNMVMNNDGAGNLYKVTSSLEHPNKWPEQVRKKVPLGSMDVIITNPPFGKDIVVTDPRVLEQYDLAHMWDKQDDGTYIKRGNILQKAVAIEQLFVERCVQWVKPGIGRVAIVLPDGILSNPGLVYLRQWILYNCQVLASIDLHSDTFQPHTGTTTSVLFLRRKSAEELRYQEYSSKQQEYSIFMAMAEKVGHDQRGNPVYKRYPDGTIKPKVYKEKVEEVIDGKNVIREIEYSQPEIHDQLDDIVALYLQWKEENCND